MHLVSAPLPKTLTEFIDAVRAGLVCDRCGTYVGSLAQKRYLPPPYPIALDKIGSDAEVEALIGFERHMVDLLRKGNFTIRHAQKEGRCVSVREWREADAEADEE